MLFLEDMVAIKCNVSTWEAEAIELKFETCLGYKDHISTSNNGRTTKRWGYSNGRTETDHSSIKNGSL